jgi:Ca2+/Na+ antiporter
MFAQPRTLRCPNCNEMINDTMKECPYCSVQLDPGVVALVAERQEKANRAYSDASYLKTAAIAMFVFLGISVIPFLGLVYYGFVITFVAVLVMLIRWQVKFSNLLTNDSDYRLAKRSKNVALVLWLVAIPLGFVVRPLIDLILGGFF